MVQQHILERMVQDIKWLLDDVDKEEKENTVLLWNNQREAVPNGISYGKQAEAPK
jgi:hypothetical protein